MTKGSNWIIILQQEYQDLLYLKHGGNWTGWRKSPDTLHVRDDIKSSGKLAIFTRLKIDGGGGQRHITEKLPLKIQTVEGIDVKMTQNDFEGNKEKK